MEIFVPGQEKPEKDYARFTELAAKLGVFHAPEVHIGLMVVDRNGLVVEDKHFRSRTFNRNYWNLAFSLVAQPTSSAASFGAGNLGIKDTGGTVRSLVSPAFTRNHPPLDPVISASAGVVNAGIVAGTGVGAENFEDFKLGTPIAQGTSTGQFSYQAAAYENAAYDAGTLTWTGTLTRDMNNNSGADITVTELAWYCIYSPSLTTNYSVMINRDLLGSPQLVPSGGKLTASYAASLTFPA